MGLSQNVKQILPDVDYVAAGGFTSTCLLLNLVHGLMIDRVRSCSSYQAGILKLLMPLQIAPVTSVCFVFSAPIIQFIDV